MSVAPLVMTIEDRRKCFVERKELESHPCTTSHFINLGVDIENGVILTPDSSPSALSNSSSYKASLHHSRECVVQLQPPPQVSRCSVLTMSNMLPSSPVTSEHDQQQGGYLQHQPTGSYAQVGSPPLQMGSPYSCSSPESQVYSPEHFDTQIPPHGSPPYHPSPSPYQSTIQSPGQYSGHNGTTPSPTYSAMNAVEGGVPPLIPFASAVTTTCGGGVPTVFNTATSDFATYTVPHVHPHMVEAYASHQAHLAPFQHMFESHLHHERHSSPESLCSGDSAPLAIKQMSNEFGIGGIEFYHPPTPPNVVDGPPNMMYHHEMCGPGPMPPHPEMCGLLTPLPNHLCPIPTLGTHGRRRPKQQRKVPTIEVDDSDIKDIPTSAQLWEFTLRVLKKPKYKYMVSWEKREEGLFRFNNAQAFAALWGKHRNRPQMSYDKVARALRYYYKRNILEQVGGRLTYRFTKRLSKLYLSDV